MLFKSILLTLSASLSQGSIYEANPDNFRAIIDEAERGSVVHLDAGEYVLPYNFVLKKDITLKGNENTVFKGKKRGSNIKIDSNTSASLSEIKFKNVNLNIYSSDDIDFDRLEFTDAAFERPYILVSKSSDVSIRNSIFTRVEGDSHGKGIQVWRSKGVAIDNNKFAGDGSGAGGKFETAINVNGYRALSEYERSENVNIINNHISRYTSFDYPEDHGIYVWGAKNLNISSNTISGWSTELSGGSIKLRNSEDIRVENNTMLDSGIFMNTYKIEDLNYLNNVLVKGNTIRLNENECNTRHGIGYWRNNNAGTEISIRIEGNNLQGASVVLNKPLRTFAFNRFNGGVYDNAACHFKMPDRIASSGNSIVR